VKKSIRQASKYVSGKLNKVLSTYTRDSSSCKNLLGYNSYTCELKKFMPTLHSVLKVSLSCCASCVPPLFNLSLPYED